MVDALCLCFESQQKPIQASNFADESASTATTNLPNATNALLENAQLGCVLRDLTALSDGVVSS